MSYMGIDPADVTRCEICGELDDPTATELHEECQREWERRHEEAMKAYFDQPDPGPMDLEDLPF